MVEAAAAGSMLDQALEYLGQGYSIFPVCTPVPGTSRCLHHNPSVHSDPKSLGKVALVKWKPYQDERATPAVVRSWWGRWPEANIAMATGRASGVSVIDCDGELATREADRRGFDIGPASFTGRVGGRHLWFKHREDAPTIFSKVGGIDFRGQGGYVLLPPSLHYSGARYRWAIQPTGTDLPELPRWIDELAAEGHVNGHTLGSTAQSLDVEYLVEHGAPEGQRDDTLFRLAAKLRGMGLPYDLAVDVVERSAERCQPPFPLDQARAKVRSAYERYEPNPEGSKPIRLNGRTVDTVTGEVLEDETWQWPVYDIAEFMARDIPAVEWLVGSLIRDQAIVGNFGGPGTFKTYFMTQLAISIAAGDHFLGIFPTRRARVLIVEEDTLEADYQQAYLRPMLKALGIKPAELSGWLAIAPPADMMLDRPERLAVLENKIANYRPDLVCLDAFYLLHSGEGMTAKDLQPILVTLKRLRRTYGCAFWLIDHNRKGTGGPTSDEAAMDRWYGGRSKSAASDAVIETRARKDDDSAASFHVLKLRGSKLPGAINVRLADGKMVVDENESEQASDGTKTRLIEWLIQQQSGRTINDMVLATKISQRHLQRAVSDLTKTGRLVKAGKGGKNGTADLWHLAEQVAGPASDGSQDGPEDGLPWV